MDLDEALRRYRMYAKAKRLENQRWRRIVTSGEVDAIWEHTRWGSSISEHPLVFAWYSASRLTNRLYANYQGDQPHVGAEGGV